MVGLVMKFFRMVVCPSVGFASAGFYPSVGFADTSPARGGFSQA